MLPRFRRYVVVNNTGVTNTYANGGRIILKECCWGINKASGKVEYSPLDDELFGFEAAATIADAGELIGAAEIDNTSDLYLGSQLQLEVAHSLANTADAAGTFDLYMSAAVNTITEFPTDEAGYNSAEGNKLKWIGSLTFAGGGDDDEIQTSNVFSIGN